MSFRSKYALTALCLAASSAVAQTTETAAPELKITLGGSANYAADTDLHDDGGSFSVFRSGGSIAFERPFSPTTDLRLNISGEYSHYFFRNINAVPGDDGSDSLDAYQFDIRPTISHRFSENFSAFGGFTVTASGMSEAHVDDALSYGVFAGVNYRVSPNVWIGGGLAVTTQLEDSALVVPLLSVNWQITPDWMLSSDGLGLKLAYKLDDAWTVYARARYDFRQFRLDGSEVLSNGVLTDQSVPIAVGITYDFGDSLKMSAEAGVVAYRRLEFRDSGGDQVGADEADPAAFVSVQVTYSF